MSGTSDRENGLLDRRRGHGSLATVSNTAEAVARVRHGKQATGPPRTGRRPTTHSSAQDVRSRLARVLVLGESGALVHGNDHLAQYPLVAANDSICGMTSARGAGPFQQLLTQAPSKNFCMSYDASNLPGGRDRVRRVASRACD